MTNGIQKSLDKWPISNNSKPPPFPGFGLAKEALRNPITQCSGVTIGGDEEDRSPPKASEK